MKPITELLMPPYMLWDKIDEIPILALGERVTEFLTDKIEEIFKETDESTNYYHLCHFCLLILYLYKSNREINPDIHKFMYSSISILEDILLGMSHFCEKVKKT